ncbi:MAG: hypothetical protein FH749_11545 [Firmicutes bacterium]|nr:hypothetical protein [Bacillota bacterium]
MRIVAALLLGALAGAVLTALTAGRQLDASHLERRALQNKVVELQETVERLENSLAEQRQQFMTVQEVKVSLIEPPDPFVALELEEAAHRLLSDLIGKDVAELDLRLVHNLLDQRIVEAEGKRFQFEVQGLHLYQRVEVLLKPKALSDQQDEM